LQRERLFWRRVAVNSVAVARDVGSGVSVLKLMHITKLAFVRIADTFTAEIGELYRRHKR